MGYKCADCGKISAEKDCPNCGASADALPEQVVAKAHADLVRYLWKIALMLFDGADIDDLNEPPVIY